MIFKNMQISLESNVLNLRQFNLPFVGCTYVL